ncbi:MAG: sigma-70 family RNA polymerase sigma factor [Natronosporangium sp.]
MTTTDQEGAVTGAMREDALDTDLLDGVRAAQHAFFSRIDPVRPQLYRYCRRLTGSVWDAEDLLQEALTRAFARAADSHQRVERVLPWLVRIATNAYLDGWRRPAPVPAELPDSPSVPDADPLEVRDALDTVATLLSPQERAAVVLKDVFDFPLIEIAAMLGTSLAAVKAALHRGRDRLGAPDPARRDALGRRAAPDRAVLDAMAAAFTAYDIERLTALLLADAVSEVVGMVYEVGAETIRRGSLHHTLVVENDVRYRAQVQELDGEPVLLLWETPADGSAPEAVSDVLRVETADGQVARVRWYYFCPETITEVTARLGVPARPHGYRF